MHPRFIVAQRVFAKPRLTHRVTIGGRESLFRTKDGVAVSRISVRRKVYQSNDAAHRNLMAVRLVVMGFDVDVIGWSTLIVRERVRAPMKGTRAGRAINENT